MKNWFLHEGMIYRNNQLIKEDLLILDGKIAASGQQAQLVRKQVNCIIEDFSAKDCIISRGFVDLHVHLREPGYESKETVASGTRAAAAGGFTSVFAMPNTQPPLDSAANLHKLLKRIKQDAKVKVTPIAALTKSRAGRYLVDYKTLYKEGIKFFSDDGDPIGSALVDTAMRQLGEFDAVLINHLEDKRFVKEGWTYLDIPAESEYLMLERDLKGVAKTHCRYHAAHISCAQSVELIAEAKARNLPVTAEVTPHHLTLSHDSIREPKANFQMKPPLRERQDQTALINAIKNGVIDIIATDHAPHGNEKQGDVSSTTPFGVTGLETAFAALYTKLVLSGSLDLIDLLRCMAKVPANIAGEPVDLVEGNPADLVVLDLSRRRQVDSRMFFSKGLNSPYIGEFLQGWPILTLVDGEEQYRW